MAESEGESSLRELITFVAQSLVDEPAAVEVDGPFDDNDDHGEETIVYELRVAEGDLGKVIGKQGRTARALRTILAAASTRIHKRAILDILD